MAIRPAREQGLLKDFKEVWNGRDSARERAELFSILRRNPELDVLLLRHLIPLLRAEKNYDLKLEQRRRLREEKQGAAQAERQQQRQHARRKTAQQIVAARRNGKTWAEAAHEVGLLSASSAWQLVDDCIGNASNVGRDHRRGQ